jgi:hypothetical protein
MSPSDDATLTVFPFPFLLIGEKLSAHLVKLVGLVGEGCA